MERRALLATVGTVAATTLAGCAGDGDGATVLAATDDDDSTAQMSPSGATRRRTITVSGSGEVSGAPDLARVHLNVEVSAEQAERARSDLARQSESVREALLEFGLAEDAITTQRFRIRERIDRRRMREADVDPDSREDMEEFVTYEGTHSFVVEIDDIDEVGAVVDTAVDAGASEVDRVIFTLSDERRAQLRDEALREAVRNARSEAETIADEMGASIQEATVADASEGRIEPVERSGFVAEADAEGGAGTPTAAATETPSPDRARTGVEAGEVTVTADIDVRYTMA